MDISQRAKVIGLGLGAVVVAGAGYYLWQRKIETDKRNRVLNTDGVYTRQGILSFHCDMCLASIKEPQERWICWTCDETQESYDVCGTCAATKLHEHPLRKCKNTSAIFRSSELVCSSEKLKQIFYMYDERKCFGVRKRDPETQALGEYEWISYGEVGALSESIGAFIQKYFPEGSFIGVCGKNCTQWYISEYGIVLTANISVPVYQSFNEEAVIHIVSQTNMKCVFTTVEQAPKYFAATLKSADLRMIVLIDGNKQTPIQAQRRHDVEVRYWDDVLAEGKKCTFTLRRRKMDDMASLRYTSGSTGMPKGTIMKESHWYRSLSLYMKTGECTVSLSYGPLAHGTQHGASLIVLASGGRTGIYSGDIATILDDSKALKPTTLVFPPRLYNQLKAEFDRMLLTETLKQPDGDKKEIEKQIQKYFRDEMFGGRVWRITTGGAPTSPGVVEWLRTTFRCGVGESYGTTEVGSVAVDGVLDAGIEVKLVDVPELNYFSTDDPPRGELWVKSFLASPGYFKDEQNTKNNFDGEWVTTGDIVELHPGRKVKIIDRKKAIFKLAQSEFVAPEKLEIIFIAHPMIANCFIWGNSLKSFILMAMIPDQKEVMTWIDTHHPHLASLPFPELCTHPVLKDKILKDLEGYVLEKDLRPFEIPRGVHIECENLWTIENELLTATMKISRLKLQHYYKTLMEDLAQKTETEIKKKEMKQILEETFASGGAPSQPGDEPLVNLGLDSVSAIRLQSLFKSKLQLNIPLAKLLNQNTTMDSILSECTKPQQANTPSQQVDWDQECTIPQDIITILEATPPCDVPSKTYQAVFLTGCTGILGAFLLVHLLETTDAMVYCLIRRTSSQSAKQRLHSTLQYHKQWEKLQQYVETRVHVIDGDLQLPQFGLSDDDFKDLAAKIDFIYHNAAWVNTILPYESVRAANVDGTNTILRLACLDHLKPIAYVSTLSVFSGLNPDRQEAPITDIRGIDLMTGYGASKLVAEVLVHKASQLGLPVSVFRLGTVSGDSVYGSCNVAQFLNRYLGGIMFMGAAPDVQTTFEMIPADHMARVICELSKEFGGYFHLFNTSTVPTINEITKFTNSFGVNVKIVNLNEWRDMLTQDRDQNNKNPLLPLASYFTYGFPQLGSYKSHQTSEIMKSKGLEWPTVGETLIHTYLSFLKAQAEQ